MIICIDVDNPNYIPEQNIQYYNQRMKQASSHSSYTPYSSVSPKVVSDKYKFSIQKPRVVAHHKQTSEFSPYKQTYHPYKENSSLNPAVNSQIRQFSPYSTKCAHSNKPSPNRYLREIEHYDKRPSMKFQGLKQTDYKTLQHNAMAREHIIQELTLLNYQLKDEVIFYKQCMVESEQNFRIAKERLGVQYERMLEQNALNEQIIIQQKEDIRVLIYQNSLLERRGQGDKQRQRSRSKQRDIKNQKQQKVEKEKLIRVEDGFHQNQGKGFNSTTLTQIEDIINKQYSSNRYLSQFICCKRSIKDNIFCLLKRLSRLQSLIRSIFDVRAKIEKEKDSDLKKTWKWIKVVVEQALKYRKLKQQEPELAKKLGTRKKSIQEIVAEFLST